MGSIFKTPFAVVYWENISSYYFNDAKSHLKLENS